MTESPKIKRRPVSPESVGRLVESGVSPVLARLYASRGIGGAEDLDVNTAGLLSFDELLNARMAAEILADAIISDSHIVISCDFDVDGCAAGTVALRALRMMGAKRIDFAMPNRMVHGYGLSPLLVRDIHQRFSPDLILTVDCGVSSFEGIAEANQLGMQVLVTDHHLTGNEGALPDALCVVNPNQPDCTFPSKNLAGVGVIFYVMLALRAELRAMDYFATAGIPDPNLGTLLDLVALATVADVVKLDKNNRILVHQGLQRIRAGRACAGINALLRVAGKSLPKASVFDLGFIVGPRLNAAGRLEDMTLGVQCLTTDDAQVAEELAKRLDEINKERREIESDMKDAAKAALEDINVSDGFSLVMYDSCWHQGVIGILASRLKDQYGRPTILFALADDGKIKGSGRSIPGLHLRDAIDLVAKRNPGMIPAFGGHAMAAGLTVVEDRFGEFAQEFEKVVRELLDVDDLQQYIETDGDIGNQDITIEAVTLMEDGVWGQGFPAPTFDSSFTVIDQRILKDKHLKLKLSKDGRTFDGIWFFHNEMVASRARLVYSLGINEYNGNVSVQILVRHAEEGAE